jgi:putative transposase
VQGYNEHHQHSGIRFVTPAARHSGEEYAILNHRKVVYEAAKQRNPQRWSGETRNWEPVGTVWLNPDKPDAGGVEIRDIAA